ncbi:LamG-like jellyroll fold domain-containing protein [Lacihabitans lacunae]|uniref:LamG-like jellyroll fold domain-containing protein n=1 Tax=Lacihabitans lacunae TaxID=1028214 RepID=A0ABV7Z200_9BACT
MKKNLLFLFLIFLNFLSNAQAPSSGLVAYYPLDGGVASDASGNGHDGNLTGGITQTANRYGEDGKAMQFNGTNGLIVIDNWQTITGGSARSISVWFKTSLPIKTEYMVSWGNYGNFWASYLGTYMWNGGRYLGFVGYNSDNFITNPFQFYDNSWHHMIITYENSNKNLYVDGVLQKTTTGALSTTSTKLRLGSNSGGGDLYSGALDDVRIYNRALTLQEIQTMYLSEVPSTYNTELVKIGSDRFIHNTGIANTYMGVRAGLNSNGSNNTFYGFESGQSGSAGDNNTFMGTSAGKVNVGSANTFIGANAGKATSSGSENIFVGSGSGTNNTTANNNIFLGSGSGQTNTIGGANIYIGSKAGSIQNTGANVMIGFAAGQYSESGADNVFLGYYAGRGASSSERNTGRRNVFIGRQSGYSNTTGQYNTYSGYYSGYKNTTGIANSHIGYLAGFNQDVGNHNTTVGYSSGTYMSSGQNNTFVGSGSGRGTSASILNSGDNNSLLGYAAGYNLTTGSENSFIGSVSGYSNTTGAANTLIGRESGYNLTTGSQNTFIGHESGKELVTGSYNTFVGKQANSIGTNAQTLQYAAAIGANAKVSVSNAIVLGDTIRGIKVGIGMTNPQYPLDVKGVVNMRVGFNNPGIKINNQDFMGIDEGGEFWVSNFKMKYKNEHEWADKVFEKGYKLKPISEVVSFAERNKRLPGMPSAETVSTDGVEIQKMVSLLLEKVEELTIYVSELEKKIKVLENK